MPGMLKINKDNTDIKLESINFQHDNFGSQLETILIDLKKVIDKHVKRENKGFFSSINDTRIFIKDHSLIKLLEKTIFDRLGLNIKLNVNTMNMCIMPMFFNENHILLNEMFRGKIKGFLPIQDKLRENSINKTGTVNLKTAKVGGIFSKYKHELSLDVIGLFLIYKNTTSEIVAILLHELGHAFTYYEFSNRIDTTNQVLLDLSLSLDNKKSKEERLYILKELAKEMNDKEIIDLLDVDNRTILGFKLFSKYFKYVKSQLPNSKYSETSSEQLADNFAARFGYGRELIFGLDKIMLKHSSSEKSKFHSFNETYLLPLLYIVNSIVMTIAGVVGMMHPLLAPIGILLLLIMVASSVPSLQDMTYDKLRIRYKRIREQYIELIQQSDIDREYLKEVINSIHSIDEIMNKTYIIKNIFEKIIMLVMSSQNDISKDAELQPLLEEIAHNDLFLKSAELKVLN